ncbi:uncharacterized protein LOC120282747 [Dioscorea cayenensis subsp. rotundata]|uniref:Uncharacterized protein LOC120282747 n=1 Tax=Dioscorea cayennensis subsp. rotundata TaxID=55577 RepID=A0AB40D5K5_DIOCR|nr:uncharacterized protein LOC120282747 [Dioscorea cayenensis subsp. rotundata]
MPRNSVAYDQGVKNFIEFAFRHGSINDMILCPCPMCEFSKRLNRDEVYDHLICKQFPKGYTIWYLHGESHPPETTNSPVNIKIASQRNVVVQDPIIDMVNDAFGVHDTISEEGFQTVDEGDRQIDDDIPNMNQTRNATDEFHELSNDGQQPLYEGCANYSKLSFILKLYHIKCLCGMSDKAMTMILELLHDAFPHIKIPSSFYDAKKTITKLGLNYEKIHACPNNCMLYWGNEEDEDRQNFKICNTSRWKESKGGSDSLSNGNKARRKIPAKVVRYFPLRPRYKGNDIDVYLQPLIRELKELWYDGANTYDSYVNEMFKLHVALMWTISDYLGLGNLSGWNVYTGRACIHCNYASAPCRLSHSRKWCFMGHRYFLHGGHKFRMNKIKFNGEQELRTPPKLLSGEEIFEQVKDIDVTFGRPMDSQLRGKRRRGASTSIDERQQWRKKSIFFELPYWKQNLLRHNLDVMHIEKNVCNNILFTLLNDSSRSNDHLNARKDLRDIGCKPDLWPDENGKFVPAVYTMNKQGKN